MKQQCEHGFDLPRGLKCSRGYLSIQLWHAGVKFTKYCGAHTAVVDAMAKSLLAKKREEIILRRFGVEPDIPEKLFKDVAPLYLELWVKEKDGDGKLLHSEAAVRNARYIINSSLIPYFGGLKFHLVSTQDVERHRVQLLGGGLSGTSVNRHHNILSSIFSLIQKWVSRGLIEPFKLPSRNPCLDASKAKMRVSERVLTDYECRKLYLACKQLNDLDGWEICSDILTTTLSVGDVEKLEAGDIIDTERSKTGVNVTIPITILHKRNFRNWRKRWHSIRVSAGFVVDPKSPEYVDARVLRKTGINWAKDKFEMKLVSEYAGHASIKTTERHYTIRQQERMRPIAEFMQQRIKQIEAE